MIAEEDNRYNVKVLCSDVIKTNCATVQGEGVKIQQQQHTPQYIYIQYLCVCPLSCTLSCKLRVIQEYRLDPNHIDIEIT